jgi:hypothetical protein
MSRRYRPRLDMKAQYDTASSEDGFVATPDQSLKCLFQPGVIKDTGYPDFIRGRRPTLGNRYLSGAFMRIFAAAALTLATLAGCASPQPEPGTQASAGEEQVCTKEFPSFSAIAITRCRSRADIEADRARASEAASAIRESAKSPKNPFPGQ